MTFYKDRGELGDELVMALAKNDSFELVRVAIVQGGDRGRVGLCSREPAVRLG